jgi:hypothetical protein
MRNSSVTSHSHTHTHTHTHTDDCRRAGMQGKEENRKVSWFVILRDETKHERGKESCVIGGKVSGFQIFCCFRVYLANYYSTV